MNQTVHSRLIQAELRQTYGELVLESTIRDSVRLAEAAGLRLPITLSAHDSKVANDFRSVATEILTGVAPVPLPAEVTAEPSSGWRRFLSRTPATR